MQNLPINTCDYDLHVVSAESESFRDLTGRRVLIYWPHGVGDWVFLSYVLPLLDPSNKYYVVRYGDDTISLFEHDNPYATPFYLGIKSPLCQDGSLFGNRHFGIDYETMRNGMYTLQLPQSLYDQCNRHGIDTLLWSRHPETYGVSGFPYHSKARYLIPSLVNESRNPGVLLGKPLKSAISLDVIPWLLRWVEARLTNFCGFGQRKLCLITRNGYTSPQKNWGYLWREDLPHGTRREGEECRDFVSQMLKKDRNWMFLVMESILYSGDDTMVNQNLNTFSYAQVFGEVSDSAGFPHGMLLKALLHLASLSVGVPAGPHHLSMVKQDLPSIGLWLVHLPSWYDEPKEASIHIVGDNLRQSGLTSRPGSFVAAAGLKYRIMPVATRHITGDYVMNAVECLIG